MAAEANKQAEADKMVVIGCCSTGAVHWPAGAGAAAADHGRIVRAGAGDCSAPHYRAGTPPLLEPALQQSITTILSVSAYLFASAASVLQGRWIYHKSTGPIGEWVGGAGRRFACRGTRAAHGLGNRLQEV